MSIPDVRPAAEAAANALKTGTTYKVYVLVGLIVGLCIFAVWFFRIEPVHGYVDNFIGALQPLISGITSLVKNLMSDMGKYFEAQPLPATIGVVTAFGTIYGVYSTVSAQRARAETERLANEQIQDTQSKLLQTSQQHLQALAENKTLQEQLDAYQNDTSFSEAQKIIGDLKTQVNSKTDQVTTLQNLVESLKLKEKVVAA